MPFVLDHDRPSLEIRMRKGTQEFTLLLNKPGMERILQVCADHEDEIRRMDRVGEASEKVFIPSGLLKSLKKLIVEHAVGWRGVVDDQGREEQFSTRILEHILDYDMTLYLQSLSILNSAFNEADALVNSKKN